MSAPARKRCVVAYATPEHQYLWTVDLPVDATIADALAAARQRGGGDDVEVPWESAPVGIFGQLQTRADVPIDGDRIELYRPLLSNPRDRRRERVQSARKSGRKRG